MTEARAQWIGRLKRAVPKPIKKAIKDALLPRKLRVRNRLLTQVREARSQGRMAEALAFVERAVVAEPANLAAQRLKADILIDLGRTEEAAATCRAILAAAPIDLSAIRLLQSMGETHEIQAANVRDYLRNSRAELGRFLNAAAYLNEGSHFQEAITFANIGLLKIDAIFRDGGATELRDGFLMEKAFSHEAMDEFEEAVRAYRKVVDPKIGRKAQSGISRCELERGRFREAAAALGIDDGPLPDYLPHREGLPALYGLGRIGEAHRLYRNRLTSKAIADAFGMPDPARIDLKDGKHRTKAAFIFTEGGPGDEIRLATAYRDIARHFRTTTITCDPRLRALLARSFPDLSILSVPRHRAQFRSSLADRVNLPGRALVPFASDEAVGRARKADFVCSMLDVLGSLRDERSDFARSERLLADPKLVEAWRAQIGGHGTRPSIGLAWRSLLQSSTRNRHYFSVSDLAPLQTVDAEFWVLQAGVDDDEIASLRDILPNVRVPVGLDLKDDFEGQAALMTALDAVVSPFTTTAELAGSLGVRTYLLSSSHQTTWRRNPDGSDIWHPTGQVIRGEPIGDKRDAIAKLATDLRQGVSEKRLDACSALAVVVSSKPGGDATPAAPWPDRRIASVPTTILAGNGVKVVLGQATRVESPPASYDAAQHS